MNSVRKTRRITEILIISSLLGYGCYSRKYVRTQSPPVLQKKQDKTNYNIYQLNEISSRSPYLKLRLEKAESTIQEFSSEYKYTRSLSTLGWLLSLGVSAGLVATGYQLNQEGYVVAGRYATISGAFVTPISFLTANKKGSPELRQDNPKMTPVRVHPVSNSMLELKLNSPSIKEFDRYYCDEYGEFEIDVLKYWLIYRTLNDNKDSELVFQVRIPNSQIKIEPQKISTSRLTEMDNNFLGLPIPNIFSPRSIPRLTVTPIEGQALAGDSVKLSLTVQNIGKGPYSRLMATTISQASWLNGRNFYFGSIKPSEEKSYAIKVAIPKNYPGGRVFYVVNFQESNSFNPSSIDRYVLVEEYPKPKFQLGDYNLVIDGGSGNSVGNADGRIQRGETIDVPIKIHNTGLADAKNVTLEISSITESGFNLFDAVKLIQFIGRGKSESMNLSFSTTTDLTSDILRIKVKISEKEFGTNQEYVLEFPVETKESPKPPTSPGSGTTKQPPVGPVIISVKPPLSKYPESKGPAVDILVDGVPIDSVSVSEEIFPIHISVWDDESIDSLAIFVGQDVQYSLDKQEISPLLRVYEYNQKSLNINRNITLSDGRQKVTVVAFDSNQSKGEKTLIIKKTRKTFDKIWVVSIGISQYQGIKGLKYAQQDAISIAQYYQKSVGVPKERTLLLTNENATLRQIKRVIGEELPKKVEEDDLVVIYFSGHGDVEELDGKNRIGYPKYILPFDASRQNLYSTALEMNIVADIMERIHARRMIFFGDYCYSGGVIEGAKSANNKRITNLSDPLLERFSESNTGRFFLTSSRANEVSVENDSLKSGIFTHFLLKALRGEDDADENLDGYISVMEAHNYVYSKVTTFTKNQQHPNFKMAGENIIIGKVEESSNKTLMSK